MSRTRSSISYEGFSKVITNPRSYPPLGIKRKDTNYCWAITIFQMLCYGLSLDEIDVKLSSLRDLIQTYYQDQCKRKKNREIKASSIDVFKITTAIGYDKEEGKRNDEMEDVVGIFHQYLAKSILKPIKSVVITQDYNSSTIEEKEEDSFGVFSFKVDTPQKKVRVKDLFYSYCNPDSAHYNKPEKHYLEKIRFHSQPEHLLFDFTEVRHTTTSTWKRIAEKTSTLLDKIGNFLPKSLSDLIKNKCAQELAKDEPHKVILDKILTLDQKNFFLKHQSDRPLRHYQLDVIGEYLPGRHWIGYVRGPKNIWYRCNDGCVKKLSRTIPIQNPHFVLYHLCNKNFVL